MILLNKNHFLRYSNLPSLEKQFYFELIYSFVKKFTLNYQDFDAWYKNLFRKDFEINKNREIIFCEVDFSIVGVIILKADCYEKKICTICVDKDFQNQGIGTYLIELGLSWLEFDFPVISVSDFKNEQLKPLLNYYGFKLEDINKDFYTAGMSEYVYNGILIKKN